MKRYRLPLSTNVFSVGRRVFSVIAVTSIVCLACASVRGTTSDINRQEISNVSAWKLHNDVRGGFQFRYPDVLALSNNGPRISLTHSIPYPNFGDCDLQGGRERKTTLVDFAVSFELSENRDRAVRVDGEVAIGMLNGAWTYEGSEGCGQITYYFPVRDTDTLIVRRAAVQALSGLSTAWNLAAILEVPGVISAKESEFLFSAILATFRLTR